MKKTATQEELHLELRGMVLKSTLTTVAKQLAVSVPFLHDVLKGRRNLTDKVAEAMGYRKEVVVVYRKVA